MVDFNNESYSLNVEGDTYDYISRIESLLNLMTSCPSDLMTDTIIYDVCTLIIGMLPKAGQVISLEDMELLKKVKQNKEVVDEITQPKE